MNLDRDPSNRESVTKKERAVKGAIQTGDAEKRERSQDRRVLERPQVSLLGSDESASKPILSEFKAILESCGCIDLISRLSKEAPEGLSSMICV